LFWYAKAAEQGDSKAQNNLGFMYSEGKGVAQDRATAHMWFNIAGVRGNEDGRKNRDFVEKLMSPAQVLDAQKRAGLWMSAHP
jgi:TPR repeat protein